MAEARNIPAQAAMGWDAARRRRTSAQPRRARDMLPAVAAALLVALAHLLFGAVQPIATLTLSAALTALGVAALAIAGPRAVTPGLAIAAGILAVYVLSGLAGPLYRAGPHLAVLLAAGACWTIAALAAPRRGALDAAWAALIWSSTAYCAWMLVGNGGAGVGQPGRLFDTAFETPANASLLFGLLAIVAMGRVLHALKQADADALVGLRLLDRFLRDALGGLLLLALALACLIQVGWRGGFLFAVAVLGAHVWWDTLAIMTRPHRGRIARAGVMLAPAIVAALAVWGVADVLRGDMPNTPGFSLADDLPNLQRVDAYGEAWLRNPVLGQGLGAVEMAGARAQTLANAKVMLAPGGPHNVFLAWLVEGGLVGLTLVIAALTLAHAQVLRSLVARRAPRTFARMAFAATALMLLHGVTDSALDLPSATWLYALVLGAACGLAPARRKDAAAQPASPARVSGP